MALRIAAGLAAILVFAGQGCCEMDLTVPYYTAVSLTCDSLALNISKNRADVDKFYWILTDGMLYDINSDLPKNIAMYEKGYTLNITDLKDENFGYYHCLVLYLNKDLKNVRKGVNVNGPDYSDLHEQYRRSAMIGGIAAAVMLALIGSGCLIYQFRFRHGEDEEEDTEELHKDREDNSTMPVVAYDNSAIEMEDKIVPAEMAYDNSAIEMEDKIVPAEEKANGTMDEKL